MVSWEGGVEWRRQQSKESPIGVFPFLSLSFLLFLFLSLVSFLLSLFLSLLSFLLFIFLSLLSFLGGRLGGEECGGCCMALQDRDKKIYRLVK